MRCRRTTHLQEIEKGLVFLLKSYMYLSRGREPGIQRQIWIPLFLTSFLCTARNHAAAAGRVLASKRSVKGES